VKTRASLFRLAASIVLVLGSLATGLGAQELSVKPEVLVPVADSWRWFQPGLGVGASLGWPLEGTTFTFTGGLDAVTLTDKAQRPILLLAARPGVQWALQVSPGWVVALSADAGWSLASRGDFDLLVNNPFGAAGAALGIDLAPTLTFRWGVEYQYVYELFQGVVTWASFTLKEGRP
jgi:hypothetical protein